MNKKIHDYINALPLDNSEKAKLPTNSIHALHTALSVDGHYYKRDDDVPLGSVKTRLERSWPNLVSKKRQVIKDAEGRTQLQSVPRIKRSSMLPEEPWCTNPLNQIWNRLRGRKIISRQTTRELNKQKSIKSEQKWHVVGAIRRSVLLILTLVQTTIATWYMKTILPYQGWALIKPSSMTNRDQWLSFVQLLPYILQSGILLLFAILFCWISASFWTTIMGFLQLLIGSDKYSISASTIGNDEPLNPEHRTALIMPIYNEDVNRVFAGLHATWKSIKATGNDIHFDIYILSDSHNPDICVSEQKAWIELISEVQGEGQIFYRRRRRRVKQKSGNIDDFCRRWGSRYSYMIVLDADSIITGDCLIQLVRLMEANPKAGIIQSLPKATGMNTLYARCQQFATHVYGPLFTAGLHFWQLGESHYWGHNAIIRMKPFIEHCALAPLPGEGSFAGSILSHDFVEASLMRRAGWSVWIAYDLPGSYETLPSNLLDELKRDRRWCHGNLMNFRLFLVKGMHSVHRVVFLTGMMSYLSAPLWFMFLTLSTALQVIHASTEPQYFLQPRQLFPIWPQCHPELSITLFASTMILLFLPKLLSIFLIWYKGELKEYGGLFCVILSLLLEIFFSILLAPVRMLFHTMFVIMACFGSDVSWNSPQRTTTSTTWSESFICHGTQLLLGLIWSVSIACVDLRFLYWMSPIVFSLILSPFVSVISSNLTIGILAKRKKVFLIPEEYSPPQVLIDTEKYLSINCNRALENGFMHAVFNPSFNALATAMAPARHRSSQVLEIARDRYVARALNETPEKLNSDLCLILLSDPVIMSRLHYHVWSTPEQYSAWITYYKSLKINPRSLKIMIK